MNKFTVCMSVYHKDKPDYFNDSFRSIYYVQSIKPSEIVLVVDGPIPNELNEVILQFDEEINELKVIRLERNMGHATARQTALLAATNEYVAIMDADDIATENRFEKQLAFLTTNKEVSIVGGQIDEFIERIDNIVGSRVVPTSNSKIYSYLKSRCPFNQMTVMFRRQDVLTVGGYKEWLCNEDYYLWIRMAEAGCKFANLPDTLVNMRVGEEMYTRRGGWQYFKSEAKLQGYMYQHGIIALPRYLFNVVVRFGVQVAMPNKLRGFIFQTLLRK